MSGERVIQEAGLGYKNDEKKDSLPALWRRGAQCEFGPFLPSGSYPCKFSSHQTCLCLLATGALDQTGIVFVSHQVHFWWKWYLVQQNRRSHTLVIAHICTFAISRAPWSPLFCGIISKQRGFYVGDCEAALLVTFYLSASASSLSLSFSSREEWIASSFLTELW